MSQTQPLMESYRMRVIEKEKRLDLQALCHEHHVKLELRSLPGRDSSPSVVVYSCPEPACLVHYTSLQGYFILSVNGHGAATDPVPQVRCIHDRMPMYLAEVLPEKRSFRLWRCPKCNSVSAVNS
jgi:hypothetical protein